MWCNAISPRCKIRGVICPLPCFDNTAEINLETGTMTQSFICLFIPFLLLPRRLELIKVPELSNYVIPWTRPPFEQKTPKKGKVCKFPTFRFYPCRRKREKTNRRCLKFLSLCHAPPPPTKCHKKHCTLG